MVLVEFLVCSAASLCVAKRARRRSAEQSVRCSSVDECWDRAESTDGLSTTATTPSGSSECLMLDDVLLTTPHSRQESSAGTSRSSFESIGPPLFALFVCARCARGIAEDEALHMCGDAAYCSRECRGNICEGSTRIQQTDWHADFMSCDVPCTASRTLLCARMRSASSCALLSPEAHAFEDYDSVMF